MWTHIKEQLDRLISLTGTLVQSGLEKARTHQILKKAVLIIASIVGVCIAIVIAVKFIEMFLSVIYRFFERHFFGITCLIGAGCYVKTKRDEKIEKEANRLREAALETDRRKLKFALGTYDKLRRFLYAVVLIEPNTEELTGLYRPLNAVELGDAKNGYYISNGLIYYQFRLPKRTLDNLDITATTSILQNLIDQKIGTYGINGLISPTHQTSNDILMISEIADMKTYAQLTLVLDFNGDYSEQVLYDRAIMDSMNRTNIERALADKDYD